MDAVVDKSIINMKEIKEHYERCEEIIRKHSELEGTWRAGIGNHWKWYKKERNNKERLWDLTNTYDYQKLTKKYRTLYWTLNFFTPELREKTKEEDKPLGTAWDTVFYSLGIDIDTCSSKDIYDAKAVLEKCASFFIDSFRKFDFRSYDIAFSGGGIYILIHPRIAYLLPSKHENTEYIWLQLFQIFNEWIQEKAEEFYKKYEEIEPDVREIVKVDSLNNVKRQWKTILSVHQSKPFAVVPLDRFNPKIDFEEAKLPLSDSVLGKASRWLMEFREKDQHILFEDILKLSEKKRLVEVKAKEITGKDVKIVPQKIEKEDFPPCIKNILSKEKLPKGATRATTLIATFLGQSGWEKEEAYKIFKELCVRFKVQATNRFECWYRKMNVPSCSKIKEPSGGFPNVGMGDVPGICEPDERCSSISDPIHYQRTWSLEALKSESLFRDIYDSFGKVLTGNAILRRNIVYDIALIGAPKMTLGNPLRPVREIRSHPAIWLEGPPESGKSVLISLLEEICPNAYRVTRMTPSVLDRGFAEQIDNGTLLIPEGDTIYTEKYLRGDLITKEEDPVVIQLRQIIEDNILQLFTVTRDKTDWVPTSERIETHPTVFIASQKAPTTQQLTTRFTIYKTEKTPSLSLESMKKVTDGFFWREQIGKYHPDELKELYEAIYNKISQLKGFRAKQETYGRFIHIIMRLALLFIKQDARIRINEDEWTLSELYSKLDGMSYEDILTIFDNIDADLLTGRLLNRQYETIMRRICASACLHIFQRTVDDHGFLVIEDDDIDAGDDMLVDIEDSFRPSRTLREKAMECIAELIEKGNETFDVSTLSYTLYTRENKVPTESRTRQIRRILNSIALTDNLTKLRFGRSNFYRVEDKQSFLNPTLRPGHRSGHHPDTPPTMSGSEESNDSQGSNHQMEFGMNVRQGLEAQIYEIVYRLCREDPRGALVEAVIERVEGYTVEEVNTKVDELIEEGNLLIKSKEGDSIFVDRG